jgi:hypothetical protein
MVIAFPVTLHALAILAVPIFFGFRKRKLWPLAVLGYLALGALWLLCLNGLWQMD